MNNKEKKLATAIIMAVIIVLVLIALIIENERCELKAELNSQIEANNKMVEQLAEEEKEHDRELGKMQAYIDALKGGKWLYMGKFTTTGYCKCEKCCGQWTDCPTFTGTTPTAGRTIAVDPSVIPLGSTVLVDGKEYIAEDTGSAIKGNKIDIYFQTHQQAVEYAKQYGKDVFIKIK